MNSVDLEILLSLADDFELCEAVFSRFAEFNNQIDVGAYTQEERVVTLVWHASGIIDNGGFEYLFEGDFIGDPGFIYTAAAFKTIGAQESYKAFQRALGSLNPAGQKKDLIAFNHATKQERDSINRQFWDDTQNICSGLARYIREHRERFRQLLS